MRSSRLGILGLLILVVSVVASEEAGTLAVPHVSVIKLKPRKDRNEDEVEKIAKDFTESLPAEHYGKFKLTVIDRATIALQALHREDTMLAKDLVLATMAEAHEVKIDEETFRRPEEDVPVAVLKSEIRKETRSNWFADIKKRMMAQTQGMFRPGKKKQGALFGAVGKKGKRKPEMLPEAKRRRKHKPEL